MLALRRPASSLHQRDESDPPYATNLPLQSRVWHLFCQGYSYTAIGEQVGLERHAVARHVRAVESLLAAEHADDLALARHRALEATFNLVAVTMDQLTVEGRREDAIWREYEQALAPLIGDPALPPAPPRDSDLPPVPVAYYRAGRTRLLGIALAALRHAIRLSGLEGDATLPIRPLPELPALVPQAVAPAASLSRGFSDPSSTPSRAAPPMPLRPAASRTTEHAPAPASSTASVMAPQAGEACSEPSLVPARAAFHPAAQPAPVASAPLNSGTQWNTPIRIPPRAPTSPRHPKLAARRHKRAGRH